MSVARTGQTATLLPNGEVLITGGWNQTGALATAEIYGSVSRKFRSIGSMATARTNHTATLVLSSYVLIVGGSDGKAALASAELYGPVTGS